MIDRSSRTVAFRYATTTAIYVAAYVTLDWVSYIHPIAQLAITPWNPPPGLSLFLLLRFGLRYVPALFLAAVAADAIVRDAAFDALALASSLVLASGYAALGAILTGPLAIGRRLRALRDVNRFVGAALVGPLIIALLYVGLHGGLGNLPPLEFVGAVSQFWIGDAIGVIVTTPLLLEYAARPAELRKISVMGLLQAGAIALALWVVFGIKDTDEFKFFYLLFLPLIWIAMQRGIRGAMVASLAIQVGLIAASQSAGSGGTALRELQFVMLTLALTALYLGMAITEREAAQRVIASQENALNHALRMASAGEVAAAVAHEVNQPLSAIGTYARACALMLDGMPPNPLLRDTLDRIAREVSRAGAVIRRLRDFYRTGSARRRLVAPAAVVDAAVKTLASRCAENAIAIEVSCAPKLPSIDVDEIQMQAVLHNLLTNAVEALAATTSARRIQIDVHVQEGGLVSVEVADNGPGISSEIADRLFEPFNSTKPEGLGLGLSMSRSIVEAHGGRLDLVERACTGATFRLTLPGAGDRDASTG